MPFNTGGFLEVFDWLSVIKYMKCTMGKNGVVLVNFDGAIRQVVKSAPR
jgi:hypothetical protein